LTLLRCFCGILSGVNAGMRVKFANPLFVSVWLVFELVTSIPQLFLLVEIKAEVRLIDQARIRRVNYDRIRLELVQKLVIDHVDGLVV